ncbi:MAG: WD40/YVTN/BNR-like repeat-containing protein [Flavobacteriaceae bacterium]
MKKMGLKTLALLCVGVLLWPSESSAQRKRKQPEQEVSSTLYSSLKYRELGPFRGGRSAAVTGVPGQPKLFYVGTTGGGVWRTTDGGITYENLSDGYFGGSIGSVVVAPSDPNVIYVGGGEVTVRGNVSSGNGIWKTTDAGDTWTFSGLPKSRHIPRMVVDPNNSNIVYAAVLGDLYKPTNERGIYKSVDGGAHWERVLFVNDQAGAVELQMDPNNPRVLYAATWRVQRTPYSLSSGGSGSALWKSTDSGKTWSQISTNKGFAKGVLGIMGVTVSPLNSNKIWAIVENKDSGGVYHSQDGGASWSHINDSRALRQRAWYYSKIYADTQDESIVYVMNVSYHKSTDGGKTFEAHRAPHGDHHDLWIAPEDNQRMIIADDGGAQVSYDGGSTWSTYLNQPTAQFYRVTTDNAFPYRIYAAQQDNSTIRIQHRSTAASLDASHWEPTAGGESAHIAVDPLNNEIVYGGSYGGYLTRVNHEKNTVRGINVWPDNPMGYGAEGMKYRFQWNFPIQFSKHNPKKLYTYSNHVHVSENEGHSWEIISPDLTRNDPSKLVSSGGPITQDNTGVEYYCTIFAANESPLEEGLLWVGSDDGLIHITRDGGKTWGNVTPSNLPEWMMINSIEPSYENPAVCYVAGTRYKMGDYQPYLYKTSDYGKSWQKITRGIGREHFTRVLRADPDKRGLLYAGTEGGMYISFDDGQNWKSFQQNLPIVPITDLALKDKSLIVATQGRSLWMLDDLTVLHQLASNTSEQEVQLYAPKTSYRLRGRGGKPSKTKGTNLPNGVIVHYYLPSWDADKDSLELTFLDADQKPIRTVTSFDKKNKLKPQAGGNQYIWNTRYEGATVLDGMIFWSASFEGAKAVPGSYTIQLRYNGNLHSAPFEIVANPNSEAGPSDMKKQFDFVQEVNKTVHEAHQTIKQIRTMQGKLEEFVTTYGADEDLARLVSKAQKIQAALTAIEQSLYQTQNRSNQDPLNFPIKLTNKLGHLNRLVTIDDFGPTTQDEAVREALTKEVEEQLRLFENIKANEIKNFNLEFSEKALNFLTVND